MKLGEETAQLHVISEAISWLLRKYETERPATQNVGEARWWAEMRRLLNRQQDRIIARLQLLGRYHEWVMRRDEQLMNTRAEIEDIVELLTSVRFNTAGQTRNTAVSEGEEEKAWTNGRQNWYTQRLADLREKEQRLRDVIAQLDSPHGWPDVLDMDALFSASSGDKSLSWLAPPRATKLAADDEEKTDGLVMDLDDETDADEVVEIKQWRVEDTDSDEDYHTPVIDAPEL